MRLAGIFQDLEHLMIFKQLAMAAIVFFFQNEAKIFAETGFHSHKHSLQIGEDIFINE